MVRAVGLLLGFTSIEITSPALKVAVWVVSEHEVAISKMVQVTNVLFEPLRTVKT
jgi:hypothetical protein